MIRHLRFHQSLRFHLSIWLLLPLLILLGVDAWLTYQRAMHAASSAFDRILFTSAKAISEGVVFHNGTIEVELPYLALEIFESHSEGQVFYRVLEEANTRTLTGYPDLPLPEKQQTDFYRPVYYTAPYKGNDLRLIAIRQPVRDLASAQNRVVWILVAETPEQRQELARDILKGSLLQEIFLVIVALLIVCFATHRGLRPLRQLSDEVARRDENNLTPVDESLLQNELKPLGSALNLYIARLRRMLEGRRRFFADAAHQLKTPLAVIQAQLELGLRENNIDSLKNQLRSALHAVHQAGHGVRQLLSLARLEPGGNDTPLLQPLDLTALARETSLEWAVIAHRQQIDLGFEGPPSVMIKGQRELLQEMLGNLIDNAIRYGGSPITIRVSTESSLPCLEVVDHGPGIAQTEQESVFKRFYRITGTSVEGSGLGLAIVKEIAAKHLAQVSLHPTAGGGLTVRIIFPESIYST